MWHFIRVRLIGLIGLVLALVLAGTMGPSRPAAASSSVLLDSADYTFVYPDPSGNGSLPDPAVWSVSFRGNVQQQPVDGAGLGIVDPDHSAYLLYTHNTPFLSGDTTNPNFANTANFRIRALTPHIPDGPAWFGDAVGWRMVLDDGRHRLQVSLSRSVTGNRQVRVDNVAMQPIPFHWDNDFANTYEIARLSNGDFTVTLTSADPSSPNPVVSQTIPAAMLHASYGVPQFAWGVGPEGAGVFYWQEAHAEVYGTPVHDPSSVLLGGADYTFNYPDPSGNGSLPDPAIWSTSTGGDVQQMPVPGLGLGMADPHNGAYLFYVHSTPYLSGDPNNPYYQNTATFRVRSQVPYVSDGSGAWSAEAIGWRMIFDDGSQRLELALARSPSRARQVRIQNSTTLWPMDFPWDNDLPNTYEIRRLANGHFVVTLTNADPSNPFPVVSQIIPSGLLSASHGTPLFAWGTGLEGGGITYWQEAQAEVYGPVVNQPPTVGAIVAPVDPVAVNTAVAVSAPFADLDAADTHTATWDWGDGTTAGGSVVEGNGSGTVSGSHAYTAAGVYTVTLTVSDGEGAPAQSSLNYVVVYDPSAGSVSGKGWIQSPPGAYAADPALSGRASFGLVAKYQRGAATPTGTTEFEFKVARFTLRSDAYQWLVVSGARAQYKGTGSVNGQGGYGFLLTAVDGQVAGGGGTDRLRLKVWEVVTGAVVYDNEMGVAEDANPTTVIGGGSIAIRSK